MDIKIGPKCTLAYSLLADSLNLGLPCLIQIPENSAHGRVALGPQVEFGENDEHLRRLLQLVLQIQKDMAQFLSGCFTTLGREGGLEGEKQVDHMLYHPANEIFFAVKIVMQGGDVDSGLCRYIANPQPFKTFGGNELIGRQNQRLAANIAAGRPG